MLPNRTLRIAESSQDVQTNDYILDSNWDYDAAPQKREYSWIIRDIVHNPDGIYRPMMLVNNQFPGPLVEVNEGDTIVVHVKNEAVNATSIHWHGIYQKGTPYMDGTPGITGCPISAGSSFTYEFTVSGQSGTYWWHAHQGVQSSDGVHGPLIIHAKDERQAQKIRYSTDRVVLISDHYHDLSSSLLWQYLKPDEENAEPVPISGLINGRTIRNCDDFPARRCDNTTANVGLPQVDLARDQNHRLRLINVGAFAEFQVQVDEHELAVTEVDGTDVQPISYHRIDINPSQRYSVIVNATVPQGGPFWLRARMITKCFTDAPKTVGADVLATVHYDDKSTGQSPTSVDWTEQLALECRDMNVTELRPVKAESPPSNPDAFYYLRSNFEIGAYRLSRGFFNSSTYKPDVSSPSLFRTIDGLKVGNVSFKAALHPEQVSINSAAFDPSKELVVQSSGVQTIDFFIDNFDDGEHPLHLHGYKYFILAQGHGAPPMTSVNAGFTLGNLKPLYDSLDLTNPLRRDTAAVEAYGWILLRLVADNPGAWAFHCHVSWHTEAGLLMQLITRSDELENMVVPQSSLDLCSAPGLWKGMGPDDSVYEDLAK
ncbi:multicopper oxidase [Dissoconium aciculare CBS 342.82]|uniref:Multicopper oxidase n=1 Tax=Dissoconium aciculare CBS 342.82 TaxID=1314786 RepID=A0A6J3MID7_9PEZI|nr:multicopper oxidase [Dissoconium aciculare CBS 342.82]KAF1827668.1 multicopper oxidase [Dissoconium aciculare CBS 342.82]